MARWIAGVDGCRAGWIAALRDLDAPERILIRTVAEFAAVAACVETPAVIAVDMPIGLPDRVGTGGRQAEELVRPLLGRLGRSVFPTSVRNVIYAGDYAAAIALARSGVQPFAPSPVANAIMPRIRQIDTLLRDRPELRGCVYEVHPELAFRTMNGERPLGDTKRTVSGLHHRRALLADAGVPRPILDASPPRGARPDDLLDALAALVVAERIAAGRGRPYPDPPEVDGCGIAAAIWTFRTDP